MEARASHAFDTAAHGATPALRAFLDQFPKGADLHVHLSGAVYAETFIKDAVEDGLCVDPVALSFAKPPCADPLLPAAQAVSNQDLYDRLVDSFSLRSFVPRAGFSGHDQFFSTFGRYGGLGKKHIGEWVDEVASRAAAQNQQYLELMETPIFTRAADLAKSNALNEDFAAYRNTLLAVGLAGEVYADREDVRTAEMLRKQLEHCGTPQAAPACKVQVRYIYQVLRGNDPAQVFAQTLLGFETVQAAMETNSIVTLYTIVRTGSCASIVPGQLLTVVPAYPDIVALPLVDPELSHVVGLAYADRDPPPPLAKRSTCPTAPTPTTACSSCAG